MSDLSENRPFPIQAELSSGPWGRQEGCSIPWWLAEEAYAHYVRQYGDCQSLQGLANRGGFGRAELLHLLRQCKHGNWSEIISRKK